MDTDNLHYWQSVQSIFQFSMGPSALALTLGMVLSALTNRFQFLMTNLRRMAKEVRDETAGDATLQTARQLVMLQSRVKILQASMLCVGFSILLLGLLMGLLFLERLLLWKLFPLTIVLFIGILGNMICGVALFLVDVRRAHKAVDIEIQATMQLAGRKMEEGGHNEGQKSSG
jgi:hypothetical protein